MPDTISSTDVLDNAPWYSLVGRHAHLAEGGDLVRRFPPDVSPFGAVRSWDDPAVWDAIVDLVGHDALFPGPPAGTALPAGWEVVFQAEGVQLVETDRLKPVPDAEAVVLGADDVPEMLALVERNQPGPFAPRTYELGRYVGIRRDGRLVAMAGERLQPAGWTEISAVCTDVEHRGQGLASRLVLDVAFHIHERGSRALMHAAATNVGAIAVYERLGFAVRRRTTFGVVRTPAAPGPSAGRDATTAAALATDRVIDITTTGRQTGEPRRIEIWFHRLDGRYYITGTPDRPRSWYANLVADPAFTFHLKESATADLPAHARPVTTVAERERVFAGILATLGDLTTAPGREPAAWVANSPLVEVVLEG